MRIIKIAFFAIMLQSCFPSFAPKEKIKKEIDNGDILLKWVDVVGTLDQDFPDYIYIRKGEKSDTICHSHNIADLKVKESVIIIGFYGVPKNYSNPIKIPEETLGHKVEIDTSFTKR